MHASQDRRKLESVLLLNVDSDELGGVMYSFARCR